MSSLSQVEQVVKALLSHRALTILTYSILVLKRFTNNLNINN